MSNLIERIDDFLFDIMGLILPGLISVCFILMPVFVLGREYLDRVYTVFARFAPTLSGFYSNNKNLFYFTLILLCYIIGHVIKVFSKYFYDFFKVFIDDGLMKLVNFSGKLITGKLKKRSANKQEKLGILLYILDKDYREIWKAKMKDSSKDIWYIGILDFLVSLKLFISKIFKDIFSFNPPELQSEYKDIMNTVRDLINEKYKINLPHKWYPIFKFSHIIMEQEKLKSMSLRYLAKYNFYRSLSLIFFLNFWYIMALLNVFGAKAAALNSSIYGFIMLLNFILWMTFHEKYKRYWTLCGNEALMSLYYFLSKPPKSDDKKEDKK